jgi:hypothetical protein
MMSRMLGNRCVVTSITLTGESTSAASGTSGAMAAR